jgi:putative ABC transport system ATP-binding protein
MAAYILRCTARGDCTTAPGPTTPGPAERTIGDMTDTATLPSDRAASLLPDPILPPTALLPPAAAAVDAVKTYGRGEAEVRALDGVTVEFAAEHFTAIMGPSGSG